MTFSIAGRCARTGMFGVALSSSSIAVGARCPHVRSGIGAVSSQNVTNPALGPTVLDFMEQGSDAEEAVKLAIADESWPDYRQIVAVDASGSVAIFSGTKSLGTTSEARGVDCAAAGNMLASSAIAPAMVAAFAADPDAHIADRLLSALRASLLLGGEAGPVYSAALKVYAKEPFPLVDLRVDWANDPIEVLSTNWELYRPQMDAYAIRAVNPVAAPSYGVPGDL